MSHTFMNALEPIEVVNIKTASSGHIRNLLGLRYNKTYLPIIEDFIKTIEDVPNEALADYLNLNTCESKDLVSHSKRLLDNQNIKQELLVNLNAFWTMAPCGTGGFDFIISKETNTSINVYDVINRLTYSNEPNIRQLKDIYELKKLLTNVRQVNKNLLVDKQTGVMWVPSINVLIVTAFEEFKAREANSD